MDIYFRKNRRKKHFVFGPLDFCIEIFLGWIKFLVPEKRRVKKYQSKQNFEVLKNILFEQILGLEKLSVKKILSGPKNFRAKNFFLRPKNV